MSSARTCPVAIVASRDEPFTEIISLDGAGAHHAYATPHRVSQKCGWPLGETDRAFEWFERGVSERSSMLVTLQTNHRYDTLREQPRFRRLVDRVGLWRAAP